MTTTSSVDRRNLKFSAPKSQYCKFCGQLITLQYFEWVRVLHPHSMLHWKRVTNRRWVAHDYFEPWKRHTHRYRKLESEEEEKEDEGGVL